MRWVAHSGTALVFFFLTGMQELQYTLAECGFEVDVTSSASLQTSLQRIHDEYDEDIAHVGTCSRIVCRHFATRDSCLILQNPHYSS